MLITTIVIVQILDPKILRNLSPFNQFENNIESTQHKPRNVMIINEILLLKLLNENEAAGHTV